MEEGREISVACCGEDAVEEVLGGVAVEPLTVDGLNFRKGLLALSERVSSAVHPFSSMLVMAVNER